MTPTPDPTQAAVDAVAKALARNKVAAWAFENDARVAVAALQADRSLLLGLLGIDVDAIEAEACHEARAKSWEMSRAKEPWTPDDLADAASTVWRKALAGDPVSCPSVKPAGTGTPRQCEFPNGHDGSHGTSSGWRWDALAGDPS